MPDTRILRLDRVAGQSGLALQGELAFGVAVLGLGVGGMATIVSLRVWLLLGVGWEGVCFGIAGMAVGAFALVHALRATRAAARRERLTRERPDEPWIADHPWDPRGDRQRPWKETGLAVAGLLVVLLALAPFHVWGLRDRDWLHLLVALVGDLVLAWLAWRLAIRVGRDLKYGRRSITFEEFPFFLGRTLRVRFAAAAPEALRQVDGAQATLRFIRERYEADEKGREKVVVEQHWAETQILNRERVSPTGEVPVSFDLPDGPDETSLSTRPPAYWEIELVVETRGLDLHSRFLVPVYRPLTSSDAA